MPHTSTLHVVIWSSWSHSHENCPFWDNRSDSIFYQSLQVGRNWLDGLVLKFLSHANFRRVKQVIRGGHGGVVGGSLIGLKASRVSQRSVTSVSRWSDRGYVSGVRVYADRLTNGVRGSRPRKSVVVRSQVTLVTWPISTLYTLIWNGLVQTRHVS